MVPRLEDSRQHRVEGIDRKTILLYDLRSHLYMLEVRH
jgi:hypothetical protein